tara:strand:- start:109 stop:630 length:522 start_codon:yes stop_codon:yes gene_type:complete
MYKYLSLLLLFPLVSFAQYKFQPGNTNFNSIDRIAINDVIDAYGIYWDNNDLKAYLSLFSDDAIGVTYSPNGERVEVEIKNGYSIVAKERMNYFESNVMQRRKMMANKLFIELNDNYAHLHQYMTLLTTNNNLKTEIVSSVFYVFKLKKLNGVWKITYREVKKTDAKLDLQFK